MPHTNPNVIRVKMRQKLKSRSPYILASSSGVIRVLPRVLDSNHCILSTGTRLGIVPNWPPKVWLITRLFFSIFCSSINIVVNLQFSSHTLDLFLGGEVELPKALLKKEDNSQIDTGDESNNQKECNHRQEKQLEHLMIKTLEQKITDSNLSLVDTGNTFLLGFNFLWLGCGCIFVYFFVRWHKFGNVSLLQCCLSFPGLITHCMTHWSSGN